eukprot:1158840-Pelagomonas_calceolata.AAC.7
MPRWPAAYTPAHSRLGTSMHHALAHSHTRVSLAATHALWLTAYVSLQGKKNHANLNNLISPASGQEDPPRSKGNTPPRLRAPRLVMAGNTASSSLTNREHPESCSEVRQLGRAAKKPLGRLCDETHRRKPKSEFLLCVHACVNGVTKCMRPIAKLCC